MRLTPLQQRVVQQLIDSGFSALAEIADHEWSRDKQIPIADSMSIGEPQGELRARFVAANKEPARRASTT
ncbi:MAG TPA: hypothetical protein VH080_09130 [Gemmatimonadaceae bacterium]|jgi:hypothetical protein|nr:hypothetical protein [Gemmatimonadaceae bacterium]